MGRIVTAAIDPGACAATLRSPRAGGYVAFEGWVRDHNAGKAVSGLHYEAYEALAEKELARILAEAGERFEIEGAEAVHRTGMLAIGDLAVWVGAVAVHRQAAFEACQYVIDELKVRLPIWKQEQYVDGTREWVACHHCAVGAGRMPTLPSEDDDDFDG